MNQIWIRKSPKLSFKSDSSLNLKKIQTWISFECDLLKIMRDWKVYYSQNSIGRRVAMPGAFKLDNLQTFQPHMIQIHTNFFSAILGNQDLSPRHRANIEDREFTSHWRILYQTKLFPQLLKLIRQSCSSIWDSQMRQFTALSGNFVFI